MSLSKRRWYSDWSWVNAGVAGDQLVDRLGGSTDAGEELVGFDMGAVAKLGQ